MKPILFSMGYTTKMASRLAENLQGEVGRLVVRKFPDEEWYVKCETPVAGREVLIVASLVNGAPFLLPLLFLAGTLKDLGARSVGLVAPYLPYMRQDKRFQPGEGISSQYFAAVISHSFDWLVTVDPHLHRIHALGELYSIPTGVVHASAPIAEWIHAHVPRPFIVGPDSESFQWVSAVAGSLGLPYEVLSKVRAGDRDVEVSASALDAGARRTPVLVDDIISTGKTLIETVKQLRGKGLPPPVCIATHAVFAGSAYDDLLAAGAGRIVSCNTIEHGTNAIDVEPLVAKEAGAMLARMTARNLV